MVRDVKGCVVNVRRQLRDEHLDSSITGRPGLMFTAAHSYICTDKVNFVCRHNRTRGLSRTFLALCWHCMIFFYRFASLGLSLW